MSTLGVVQPQSASVAYHQGNQFPAFAPGTSDGAFYQPRATTARSIDLPLAAARYVDMGISLAHNLTVGGVGMDLFVQLYPNVYGLGGIGSLLGPQVAQEIVPSGGLCIFQAEKGSYLVQSETATRRVSEVPELRLPYGFIRIRITPFAAGTTTATAPDAGEVAFVLNRRA